MDRFGNSRDAEAGLSQDFGLPLGHNGDLRLKYELEVSGHDEQG